MERRRPFRPFALFCVLAASLWVSLAARAAPGVYAVVLGIAQDGGVPHIGCAQEPCRRARRDPRLAQRGACLGLVDEVGGRRFLVEATPDLPSQLEALGARVPDGVLVTHAHIGHYTGLMYLGREALGARAVPVYASSRMAAFLRGNGPWSQLVGLGQIELRELEPGAELELTPRLRVTALRVPHRDEYSDTVGFRVRGPSRSLLFVPDIDKWEKWDRRVEDEVAAVDVALLDGTFASADELPGRRQDEVPHPTVGETVRRLAAPGVRGRVLFIHLNHTNELLWDAAARRRLEAQGFAVARQGQVLPL
jgi:pyrroloquinoline quinone biosynthesis protein B